MELICVIDLTSGTVEQKPYDILTEKDYGRGLAHRLLREHTPLYAGRFSADNAMVLVPGLFAGCRAPSAGRMTVLAKGSETGVQIANITGNMPQKLGSLGVCALVVKGVSPAGNAVVHLSENGVQLLHMPALEGLYTDAAIAALKTRFGREAAILGTGIAGDMRLPLATLYATYPDGEPAYNCSRGSFGDIPSSKGLRAIVVTGDAYFARACAEPDAFWVTSKRLTTKILENEVCGSALPAHGSVTLLRLQQNGGALPRIEAPAVRKRALKKSSAKTNYCCAPLCVIGCLNRHARNGGERYSSPDQSELAAALKEHFALEDNDFLHTLQRRLRNLCLASLDFVLAARIYCSATEQAPTKARILSLVDAVAQRTDIGRLLGSGAAAVAAAFSDRPQLHELLEPPVHAQEQRFAVRLTYRGRQFAGVNDMDMLYHQVFLLENLGLCLFASFALVDNAEALELLGDLFRQKCGLHSLTPDDLILYAANCRRQELEYARLNGAAAEIQADIPTFTKVLYQYFSAK